MAEHHYIAVSRGKYRPDTDTDFSYGTTTLPASATVAADIAVLVADGASPTQAHVNTLNTDWGTYLTAVNALLAGLAAGDLVLYLKDSASMTRLDVYEALIALQAFVEDNSNIAGTQFPVN
jgi:hypothetical protein